MIWLEAVLFGAAVLALALALLLRRARRSGRVRRARRGVRAVEWTAAAAALVLAAAGGLVVWALPPVDFPEPSGGYAVGTTTVQWTDRDRDETWTEDPDDRRTVVAQLWYPAEPGTGTAGAPYLGRTAAEARVVTDAIADGFGLPGSLLSDAARARTRAAAGAAPVRDGAPLPVVVFSPGLGGVRGQNTAWAQELASHGYVVAALDHPFDSAAVVLDDGTVVRGRLSVPEGSEEEDRLVSEWTSIRADDMRLALTRLQEMDADADGPFADRLDPGRVVAAGHSFGGSAALHAAAGDDRFAAVIDIDGFPHEADGLALPRPLLVLVAGRGTGDAVADARYADAVTAALAAADGPSCALTVEGAAHLSFTDAPLYLPPVPSIVGSDGRTRPLATTADATLAFLDAALRDPAADPRAALAPFGATECDS
ncbi:platelet-activating factor acetylhydrolase isoform II [Nocardiopsis sp. Huas11]|uniref:alpha/beta hydrolase family protein n=1 Tax=Nocardiopsis sp. Huas11 TaxID=2183912 RepID=UPI000EABD81D|nr:dienelactone hydrolase family protein [Nocardiopsis sp. Huas11]RKS07315.1 platelet-activating factor acetylhydrolase isoform II [Nocardiopsis sp. Huas11]